MSLKRAVWGVDSADMVPGPKRVLTAHPTVESQSGSFTFGVQFQECLHTSNTFEFHCPSHEL